MKALKNPNLGLLLIRIGVGIAFITHGLPKLQNLTRTSGFFGSLGVPLPEVAALLVGIIETFGGLALILGIFTRASALLLSAVMIGAISLVHFPKGYGGQGGYEYTSVLLAVCLGLAFLGSGSYALRLKNK